MRKSSGLTRRGLLELTAAIPAVGVFGGFDISLAQGVKTLKAVMVNDLRSLDPVVTPGITVQHAFMVYDTLLSRDEKLEVHPQMAEGWRFNGLEVNFTLRPGLEFHDGTPVTAADVIPSIKRWALRAASGQLLMEQVADIREDSPNAFTFVLKNKFPFIIDALCDPAAPLFVMRKQEASKPVTEQVNVAIGSGPFKFVPGEWVQGSKAVYVRNDKYAPRKEVPSGWAGDIHAKVDRVEFLYIPDFATRISVLKTGEAHLTETVESEQLVEAQADQRLQLVQHPGRGWYTLAVLNHLHPPFNHPSARKALLHIVKQDDVMMGATGNKSLYQDCYSFFACNSAYASDAGTEPLRKQDFAVAEKLFKEAGYKGEPIVVMMATDQPNWFNATQVMISQMKRLPFLNIRPVSMDWGALVTRRANKQPPANGGWSIFVTTGSPVSLATPLQHFYARASCEKAWFGWPCDDEAERMRKGWGEIEGEEARKKAARELQERWFNETVPFIPLGFMKTATVYRKDLIKGVLSTPLRTPMWNIEVL